ncbi:Alkyldihydroxyacetonephosphate synthase [Gryllus bimaculatus]|nr:Alkyldihydroxyacetonephosphate synthase [Gryllus bimaculatus]
MLSKIIRKIAIRRTYHENIRTSVLYFAARKLHPSQTLQQIAQNESTTIHASSIQRGNYSQLTSDHIHFFESILDKQRVLTDPSDVEPYNVDWLKLAQGQSKIVLKPKTTEEVSAILKYCNDEILAVCPQGGNTGVVGGSVPVFDEIVISTSLMNQILSLDELSGVVICQAGCILETLENYLSDHGFQMPLDLGAKGSCQIGGNVSTNAGGIRLLRYGSLQGNVLGVEAVKANGEVIDCLSSLKKDNTGYHLKHLFIGSEGTLGIVTKVALQCPPISKAINVAFLGLKSFEEVLKTSINARKKLGEILSSCEMMDHATLDAVTSNLKVQNPIGEYPFYMLLETSGGNSEHDQDKLNFFLQSSLVSGEIEDGVVASEPSKIKAIWEIRERAPEAFKADGWYIVYDISVPLKHFYEIVPIMSQCLAGTSVKRCTGMGHLGDGNLHLNVSGKEIDPNLPNIIEPILYEWTSLLKGSISAEHGIGIHKTKYLHYSKSNSSIQLMHNIKQLLDPKGILNPYKIFHN